MPKLPNDPGQTFRAEINQERRRMAEANHTATHLLHQALRTVLGEHVEQKGSFVSPEVLRFDFSHYNKLTPEEIRQIEELVTQAVRADYPREEHRNIPIAEARTMGAMALFGEKYGEEVRVMKYGTSIELCGGTHLPSTGMIGSFRIVSESSIAAGVRRIEAVTATNAEAFLYKQEDTLKEIKALLNNTPDVVKALQKLLSEESALKAELDTLQRAHAIRLKKELLASSIERSGYRLFVLQGEEKADIIKDIAFQLRGELQEPFVFVAATTEGARGLLSVMLSEEAVTSGLHAGNLVKEAARLIQGGGGGQPHFATAGGKDGNRLPEALELILSQVDAHAR